MAADDLEADIRAAQASVSAPDPVAPSPVTDAPVPAGGGDTTPAGAAPEVKAETPAADRPRDDSGKFVKTPEAPKPAVKGDAKPAALVQTPASHTTAAAPEAPKPPETTKLAPPQNWKGNGKVDWNKLPQHVQREIADDYANLAKTQSELDSYRAAITPERSQILSATYGSVGQGLQNLFAVSDLATKNPTGFILWFAQQRGINLAQMLGQGQQQDGQPTGQPAASSQNDPIMQRLSQLERTIQSSFQQQQQAVVAQGTAEINTFAADPAHPYFNDVRVQMGHLIQNGQAKDLAQAYEMACWASPDIRPKLIEDQRQRILNEQATVASQALQASSSISGSPAGAQIASDEDPNETLEQTLQRAQRAALGRS